MSMTTQLVFDDFCDYSCFSCGGIKKVLFLHQERVKQLPACISEDLCSLDDIIQYYNNSLSCSFYEMCGIKPAPAA